MHKYIQIIILSLLSLWVIVNLLFWFQFFEDKKSAEEAQNIFIEKQKEMEFAEEKKLFCMQTWFDKYYIAWANRCVERWKIDISCHGKSSAIEKECTCMLWAEDSLELDNMRKQQEEECRNDTNL